MTFTPHKGSYPPVKALEPETDKPAGAPAGGDRIKVLHIINDLSIGGAEMMLYKLLSGMSAERFAPVVMSLVDRGNLRERIEALGIPVYSAGMSPEMPSPVAVWRLIRLVRQIKPDLIQGWMAHGNLVAQLVAGLASRRSAVLWNIRQTLYSFDYEKRATASAIKLCARLSKRPARILYNSRTSSAQHTAIGYSAEKTLVIPNGFDTELFAPSREARLSVRSELGVAENTFLIGLVGRFHPMKGHAHFLRAAKRLLKTYPDVQFVLSGKDVSWANISLCELVQTLGLVERVHLLGERQDMPRITAALDIASSSSSYGEGFPNVIGEAMSCAVPCVVTDVSDLPWVVGETGRVVPPRNPEALARAWADLIELGTEGREALGAAARARVIQYFPLGSVVAQYEALYESVIARKGKRPKSNVRYHRFSEHDSAPAARGRDAGDRSPDVRHSASSRAG
ncbi:MAG TPA: glycosyltransferase [Pyrinomonadaceae bacterium]|jgi:glycosyltransferase involved in cell wall biosynthesis|nr:glycosyltransferase [Pyrinomonadaceae bacterium]